MPSHSFSTPKVSIIIPVYNMEKYLKQCLESIVNQTLKEIEIICIDDGSTDTSLEILQDYAAKDARFVILAQENTGQGLARNKCIEVARGEYLGFVDPDDWVDLHMYEEMYNAAVKYDCEVVECNHEEHVIEDNTQQTSKKAELILEKTGVDIRKREVYTWRDIHTGFFLLPRYPCIRIFKRDFIKKENLIFTHARRGEDQPFSIGACLATQKMHYIDKPFYKYRVHKTPKKFTKNERYYQDPFIFYSTTNQVLKKNNVSIELYEEMDKHSAYYFLHHALSFIPLRLIPKFLYDAKKTLTQKQFALFKKPFIKNMVRRYNILPFVFSFKKKQIEGKTVKVLSIFCLPLIKIGVQENKK